MAAAPRARIRDGHVGFHEGMALLVLFLSIKLFLVFPQSMAEVGLTAGWMIPLAAAAVATVAFWPTAALLAAFPGRSIVEIAGRLLGPAGALLLGVATSGLLLSLFAIITREFAGALITAILRETPISVVMGVFMGVAVMGAYKGIEPIARTCWLLAPWLMLGVAVDLVLVLPWAKLYGLRPLWGPGPLRLALVALPQSGIMSEVALLGVVAPFLRTRSTPGRLGMASIWLSAALMAWVVATFLIVFPPPTAAETPFPLGQMARLIFLGRFVQRLESIFLFLWTIGGMLGLMAALYGAAVSLAQGLGLPVYRPRVVPLALVAYALAFLPGSLPEAATWELTVLRPASPLVAFALPALLWACWAARRGRGGSGTKGCRSGGKPG